MSPDRPLVILAGPINAAGHANLEREARVVMCEDETEAGFIKVAAQAQGILFRTKPRCTESLISRPPPSSASRSSTHRAPTRRRWPSTR